MQRFLAQRGNAAMLAACVAVFLTALDQTVVVTALSQITQDLSIPITNLDHAAWIVSGYLLGYVIAMPLMGRISDLFGRRRVFIVCLAIFALGSLFCALAPLLGNSLDISFLHIVGIDTDTQGLTWLVAARFVQAAGGGAVVPVAMAVAGDFYGQQKRAIALGLIGMVTEAGSALGPLYGAIIVQTLGWQYIFYLNLPIIALLLIPIILFIPEANRLRAGEHSVKSIDLPGALLLGSSLTCLSLGLSQEAALITVPTTVVGAAPGQNNLWLILAALVLFAAFLLLAIYNERRSGWPVVQPSLFKNVHFSAAALVSLLSGIALIIALVDIPIFNAFIRDLSAIDSGLALLRLTAMIPIGAMLGGWLCGRIGSRWTALAGLLLSALGFWLMYRWPLDVDWTQITISTVIGGLGFGLVIAPISTSALNAVGQQHSGLASAVVTILRMIGMILGLAALTSWGLGRFRALAATFKPPAGVQPLSQQYLDLQARYYTNAAHEVFTDIFLTAGVLCLVALLPALFLENRQPGSSVNRSTDQKVYNHLPGLSETESEASILHGQREQ